MPLVNVLLLICPRIGLFDLEPAAGEMFWPVKDVSGDVVALCDLNGTGVEARVIGRWTYDVYGEVLTAEQIHVFPGRRVGHKGLFVERLDAAVSTGSESPRLTPFAHNFYHSRNRVYVPTYGRFAQRDPNQTAMQLMAGPHSGRGVTSIPLAFSFEGWYGDGRNLYQYLGSNPLLRQDPMGLSYDPFDMVDDYLAESAGARAAFLSQMGQDAKAIAILTATIASYLPFPGVGLVGDLALWAMGEQSSMELGAGIALGINPGGKLAGKLGGFVSNLGASAWRNAKNYAGNFGGFVAKEGAGLITSLARRAKNFLAKGCGCFEAGQIVWTARGPIPIERIEVGDYVLAQDETTGESSLRRVIDTFVRRGAPIVAVTVSTVAGAGETFRTTEEHHFYVPNAGWVRVDQLEPGDPITTLDGQDAFVLAISYTGEQAEVFNLEVEGMHNYYVGASGVLVHNSPCKWIREWYEKRVHGIPSEAIARANAGESLENAARWAHGQRNSLRTEARSMMRTNGLAEQADQLDLADPNRSWDYIYQRYNGDFRAIIDAAGRSRALDLGG